MFFFNFMSNKSFSCKECVYSFKVIFHSQFDVYTGSSLTINHFQNFDTLIWYMYMYTHKNVFRYNTYTVYWYVYLNFFLAHLHSMLYKTGMFVLWTVYNMPVVFRLTFVWRRWITTCRMLFPLWVIWMLWWHRYLDGHRTKWTYLKRSV